MPEGTGSATGIGASVKRKEDFRFLTGRGTYTDDINRMGQTYAYILRSPHAAADIALPVISIPGLRFVDWSV